MTYDYIEKVVHRYKSVVGMWNIGCGVNNNENFIFTAEQMIDLVRMTTLLLRQARKGARAMYELSQPFGEHCAFNRDSVHPISFIERLVQEGVRLDAVGVQLLFGQGGKGRGARDLMQISSLLDRFFLLEIPVLISAMGVPSTTLETSAGWWQEVWSPELQAKWISHVFAISLSKPFVESLFWTDLYDHAQSDLPSAGLITDAGKAKPALQRLVMLRKHLRKPLGPLKLPTKNAATSTQVGMER
jgi:hypothetical protein